MGSLMRVTPRDAEHLGTRLRKWSARDLRDVRERLEQNVFRPADVHEIRKCTKRVSATALVVQAGGGPDSRAIRALLREIRHHLSCLRDVDVRLDTLPVAEAGASSPRVSRRASAARRELRLERRLALEAVRSADVRRALRRDVAAALAIVHEWPAPRRPTAAAESALERARQRCRRALVRARRHRTADAWHTLRRRLVALRQLSTLLEPVVPGVADDLPRVTKAAAQLGAARDLVDLVEWLHRHPGSGRVGDTIVALEPLLRRSAGLRSAASRNASVVSAEGRCSR